VRQVNAKTLDLAFPAPPSALDLQLSFDGKTPNGRPVEQAPAPDEPLRSYLYRVELPSGPSPRASVLEVAYQLAPTKGSLVSSLQSVLQPVTIPGAMTGVPVRWQIDLPPDSIALPLDGDAMWRWGRRGWLVAPRPAVNAGDIERWFWGDDEARAALSEEEAERVPSHACWRTNLAPLTLYHVPQQAWLLGCSLLVLATGLVLSYAAFRGERGTGRWFWGLILALGLATAGLGLVWPGLLTVLIYGGQPGFAVLLVILSVQWFLHERYRRRVVFMPGFRRVKSGSSMVRKPRPEVPTMPGTTKEILGPPDPQPRSSATGRARHEPSTVDAPKP
jgi:hypothetical protein